MERYLSLLIALAIVVGVGLDALFLDAAASIAALEVLSDDAGGRLLLRRSDSPAATGSVGDSCRELVAQAAHHELPCLAVRPWRVFRLDPGSHRPGVRGRDDSFGGRSLYGVVFVWTRLSDDDPNYTLVQVALNDVIMVFAFAPIAALLLGINASVVGILLAALF